jgi:hypothetical protein
MGIIDVERFGPPGKLLNTPSFVSVEFVLPRAGEFGYPMLPQNKDAVIHRGGAEDRRRISHELHLSMLRLSHTE